MPAFARVKSVFVYHYQVFHLALRVAKVIEYWFNTFQLVCAVIILELHIWFGGFESSVVAKVSFYNYNIFTVMTVSDASDVRITLKTQK